MLVYRHLKVQHDFLGQHTEVCLKNPVVLLTAALGP